MAISERVLQEGHEPTRPEDAPMGLVWLKCHPLQVSCLGLDRALGTVAYLHKGLEAPAGEPPSAVICYPSTEESLAAEVENVLSLAPYAVVLVFVPSPNMAVARAALGAGANGLLHAGLRPEEFLRAVCVALEGETVLPRCLLAEWLDEHRLPGPGVLLSDRKKEILKLVCEGFTNAEIAGHLYLSESTIKQHLRAAYKALGVRNRTEAAALLRRCAQVRATLPRSGGEKPANP